MCTENLEHNHEQAHEHEHSHTHEHEHTHSDGTTHSHAHPHEHCHEHTDHTHEHEIGSEHVHSEHEHTHTHSHSHSHSHSHDVASSPEEALALLNYMLDHNRHHAEELHDLGHCFDDVEADLIHDAVDKLTESNALIEQALSLIKNK